MVLSSGRKFIVLKGNDNIQFHKHALSSLPVNRITDTDDTQLRNLYNKLVQIVPCISFCIKFRHEFKQVLVQETFTRNKHSRPIRPLGVGHVFASHSHRIELSDLFDANDLYRKKKLAHETMSDMQVSCARLIMQDY